MMRNKMGKTDLLHTPSSENGSSLHKNVPLMIKLYWIRDEKIEKERRIE
jgi:uncharacterized membrane protein (UPF0127 family)